MGILLSQAFGLLYSKKREKQTSISYFSAAATPSSDLAMGQENA